VSFPRYPKYKDSGVEWLGEVPEHWTTLPLKRDLDFLTSGSRGWADNYSDDGELFIRIANLTRDGIALDLSDIQRVVVPADVEGSRTKVQTGDVLFSITAYLGSVAVVPDELESAYVSQHVALARLRRALLLPRWVGYVALSLVGQTWFAMQSYGGTKIQLSLDDVRGLPVTVPPTCEQHTIVEFLDRETGKIDELVAGQQRLMGLLKEKRQAVISHAVTKGLNPHAPMKPSGIDWLGDMPSHWETCQSRRMFAVRSEPALPSDQMLTASQKYGVIFQSDFVQLEGRRVVEVIMGKESLKHVEPNDFIISMRSFQGGIEWCTLRGSTSFHYVMLRPVKDVHPPFFAHLFKSATYIQALRTTTDLIRDGQELRYSNFAQVALPVVPMQEQAEIATFVDREVARFDALISEAEKAIDLLQERRTALISAAVTGQIDVRELAVS